MKVNKTVLVGGVGVVSAIVVVVMGVVVPKLVSLILNSEVDS